jgi:hypothetical protein
MMSKGLKIAEPPQRRPAPEGQGGEEPRHTVPRAPKFDQVAPSQKVQFNKRVTREVADGFEILAIRTRRKVPELLAEALELLEQKHGRT